MEDKLTLDGIFSSIESKGCLAAQSIVRNLVGSDIWNGLIDENKLVLVRKVQKIMKDENINPGIVGTEKCFYVCKLNNENEMDRVLKMLN